MRGRSLLVVALVVLLVGTVVAQASADRPMETFAVAVVALVALGALVAWRAARR